jgi:NAD(P)-dependent dehydrogenase (short-subunit alcohol dehydrogenase family)
MLEGVPLRELRDKVVAITGAAAGIGRAVAMECARQGAHVALCDIDEGGLEGARIAAVEYGVQALAMAVDVSRREQVEGFAAAVAQRFGRAHVIINNAGVGLGSTVRDVDYADFEWLMGINFWGVVYGTKAFLPLIERQTEGHIVNVSSVAGMIAFPTMAAYNASKFAVRGFTETLRLELQLERSPIGVTSVHPGGIRTKIASNARTKLSPEWGTAGEVERLFDRLARTSPETAAKAIVDGIVRNKPRVLIGADAHVIDQMQRRLPTGYQAVLSRLVDLARPRHRNP